MHAITRKHKTLQALRQRLRLTAIPDRPSPLMKPGSQSQFPHALFAQGLHEILGASAADYPAALAFAAAASSQALTPSRGTLFLGFLASDRQERGLPYGLGIAGLGLDATCVHLLAASSEKTLLWAAEEIAFCEDVGAAIIVLGRQEKLYGFTASRRLKLRQESSSVPLFIVRPFAGDATAATARWRVAAAPSQGQITPSLALPLPGATRLSVRLERYAGLPSHDWEIELDAAHTLRVAAPVFDRAAPAYPASGRAA